MKIPFGIIPFFSFSGCAEDAVNYYVSVFPGSKINSIEYFAEGERGIKGQVKNCLFTLMGNSFMAFDIDIECPPKNWSTSFYTNCPDEKIFNTIFEKLSNGGNIMMGPEAVFNLRKAAWVTDKYGVTWQIIWE